MNDAVLVAIVVDRVMLGGAVRIVVLGGVGFAIDRLATLLEDRIIPRRRVA